MALMYCRECGKQVSSEAPTCPHCGVPQPVFTEAAYPVNIAPPQYAVRPAHNTGLAAVLSFFWPGLGQIYRGDVGAGIGWMFATFIGYVCFIIPGLILHIACIVNAADSTR
jgi:TM2 domain-containing membrane protein YozV